MSDAAIDTCPLPPAQQRRNLWLFAANVGLNSYLSAPVLYIGTTQATLFDKLGVSKLVANLPSSVYFAFTLFPVFLAWYFSEVRLLKRVLVTCQALMAVSVALVAALLWLAPLPEMRLLIVLGVILQAAAAGTAGSTSMALLWEALGRGATKKQRGLALSLAFGVGPFLAFGASMFAQLVLAGNVGLPYAVIDSGTVAFRMWTYEFVTWEFPGNFAALYAIVAPMLAGAALLSCFFIVPLPATEVPRKPLVEGVFGGIGDFLRSPVLRWAAICTFLGYSANLINPNLGLNIETAMGVKPQDYAGYQMAIRFLCKGFAGLFLGWLVARYTPWSGMTVTIAFFAVTLIWALFVTGPAYLFTFGLFGAGELLGAYAVNYILSASPPRNIRQNMVLANLIYAPTFVFGLLFGKMVDKIAEHYQPQIDAGALEALQVNRWAYQSTIATCLLFLLAALVIAIIVLPRDPRPDRTPS